MLRVSLEFNESNPDLLTSESHLRQILGDLPQRIGLWRILRKCEVIEDDRQACQIRRVSCFHETAVLVSMRQGGNLPRAWEQPAEGTPREQYEPVFCSTYGTCGENKVRRREG
jgi:hypothetical protein